MGRVRKSEVAESIPFDNSTNGFVAEDVQAAIEEINNVVDTSASPGFTWGSTYIFKQRHS
jgi:type II secretory pathway component HofQ